VNPQRPDCGDGAPNLVGDLSRLRRCCTREVHGKLVASDTHDKVCPPDASLHGRRDPSEQLVACRMTKRIVHTLEAVEIER
jgi:hypothetical protein